MGNSARRDKRRAASAELQRQALELRKTGLTYDEIAQQLALSNRGQAYKLVHEAIEGITREPAKDVLELELQRLDAVLAGLWPAASTGDPRSVDSVLRIIERRAKLLGIDAPVRSDVTESLKVEGVPAAVLLLPAEEDA